MFDDFSICPYPGLRSFTEEESLYFKGRDTHIQEITRLLQDKKFLMVTGASGDGKSSVIFAGLIPSARAGFFRAKYNNWSVVHFRPERSPVDNFAGALAPQMGDKNLDTVKTELRRGFGSLTDLYKNSPLFVDESSKDWLNTDPQEKESLTRSTRNLLIVVDQFEEFFTNAENFVQGVPSQDSQILLNLLLETAMIARKEDLPIYIVFTMRSDFIGQCAAFRGLPEFIGYSQFFVPRLKRNEFQQIIEEPAELNGNRISRRLVERLLYDLSEGIDQLPILQHVLNQVWHKADLGKEEMDLIHYAMVGGMSREELPNEDQGRFESWFESLPEYKRENFSKPGLNKVLDIHANELYEGAWQYYYDQGGDLEISKREAKNIVAMTFACLTKIDDSRAVRNLMSLEEITKILNRPNLNSETVGRVINYYREQGNTFIRPFINDEEESKNLSNDTVLDITHESLIRNWERLKKWADKEFEYYETYLDFKKQLDKWLESGQSRGYLLPIGPLTYFENWYDECKPNQYWINRYTGDADELEKTLQRSAKILDDSRLFLKKSAQKVAITRAYMKHGTAKLAAVLAIFLVVVLSGFFYYDADKKLNETVLRKIEKEGLEFLNSEDLGNGQKGNFLTSLEYMEPGKMIPGLKSIDSLDTRLGTAISGYENFVYDDPNFDAPIKYELLEFIISELRIEGLESELKLEEINDLLYGTLFDTYHGYNDKLLSAQNESLKMIMPLLKDLIEKGEVEDMWMFNRGIDNILNLKTDPMEEVNILIKTLSPFEPESKEKFDQLYPREGGINNGLRGSITHNGGYQEMAYLYAAVGDIDKVIQCTDSVMKYNSNYWQLYTYNNGFNILGYLLQFGHTIKAGKYLDYIFPKTGYDGMQFYSYLLDRTGYLKQTYSYGYDFNPGLSLLPFQNVEWIFEAYERDAASISDRNERHFYLAHGYKLRGLYTDNNIRDGRIDTTNDAVYNWFDKAVSEFNQLDQDFLQNTNNVNYRYWTNGPRSKDWTNRYYFLYPDLLLDGFYSNRLVSNSFVEYILDKDLLTELYQSAEDLESINDWLANYYEYVPWSDSFRNLDPINIELIYRFQEGLSLHPKYQDFDNTFFHLLLANGYFALGDFEIGKKFFDSIDQSQLQVMANRWEYVNFTFIYNQITKMAKYLAVEGMYEESMGMIELLPNNNYKSVVYSNLADYIYGSDEKVKAFIYLDSAMSKGNKVDISQLTFPDYRFQLIQTMSGIGGKELNGIAREMFVELSPGLKSGATNFYILGMAWEGNYNRAVQAISPDDPLNRQMGLYSTILSEEGNKRPLRPGWEKYKEFNNLWFKEFIPFNLNF